MYHNHWKRLLCLALVLTLLMSISAVLAAPYDAKNTENTYDQTGNQFTPSIDTDLSYDSYACLGDSIAAGFGDYDYYPDDGSLVEDINQEDYSRAYLDSLKWSSIDNYTLYYDDTIPGWENWPIASYVMYTYYDFTGQQINGVVKYDHRDVDENGETVYLDKNDKPVTVKEGFVPYTRSENTGTENDFTYMGMRAVDKAYHSIVAKSVGASTLYPLGYSGTRTTEIRGVLDPTYKGDEYLFSYGLVNNYTVKEDGTIDYYTPSAEADWNHRSYDFVREKYLNAIHNSDLITLNLGSNDIMTIPVINAMGKMSGTGDAKFVALAKEMLGQSYPEMLNTLFSTANTMNNLQQTLTTLMSLMINGYRLYFENIMPVIDTIKEENPDADIAVIGLYNPLKKVKLTDDSKIAIGELGSILITGINAYLKANADKHGYAYVDVTDTETQDTLSLSAGISNFFGRIMTDVHPKYAGHEYMAGQILSSLEAFDVEKGLSMPYTDVKGTTAYATDIQFCYDNGLISGTSRHTYAPNMNMTRGMFIASMYALGNKKVNMSTGSSFSTIMKSSYFTKALSWAYSKGITFGVNKSVFSPLTRVTREQMAQMLYQYAGKPKLQTEAQLDDSYQDSKKISKAYKDAVLWAATNGFINAEDGFLKPKASVTRGEMAHALHVYMEYSQG